MSIAAHVAPTTTSRRSRLSVIVLAVLTLTALVLPGLAMPAHAEVNPNVKVAVTSVERSDREGNVSAGNLTLSAPYAKVTFSWDAKGVTVAAGDSFTIDVTPYFVPLQGSAALSMLYNGAKVGECVFSQSSLTCTFNEEYVNQQTAGGGSGSGWFVIQAVKETSEKTVDFRINAEQVVTVNLPGQGGIGPRA